MDKTAWSRVVTATGTTYGMTRSEAERMAQRFIDAGKAASVEVYWTDAPDLDTPCDCASCYDRPSSIRDRAAAEGR
jgi:hypothetical protein